MVSLLRLLWLLCAPFVLMLGLALAGWLYQWAAQQLAHRSGFGNARSGVRQRPFGVYWILALILLSALYMQLGMSISGEKLRFTLLDGVLLLGLLITAICSLTCLELHSNRLIQRWPFGPVRSEIHLEEAEIVNDATPWYGMIFLLLESGIPLLVALLRKRNFMMPTLDPDLRLILPGGRNVKVRASALPDERETFMIAVDVRIARLRHQSDSR